MIAWLYAGMIWVAFGLGFWIDYQRYYGWPRRWRARHNREEGWRDAMFVSIPFSIVGGPIWWIALMAMRILGRG
ncbi:MAG: hypothetical protein Q7S17_07440 [Xanthobacteraceae bacterium]|nr:hypothetical protein [Xanthobacteraceae bacterium]